MSQTRTVFTRYSPDGKRTAMVPCVILGTPLVKAVQNEGDMMFRLMVTPTPDDGRWPDSYVSPPFATEAEALAFQPQSVSGPDQPVVKRCSECGRT